MTINAQQTQELLETLAIQQAVDTAPHGFDHASRVGRLKVNSWQADIIRKAQEIPAATNPSELRALMAKQDAPLIFLPQSAMITSEIIDRICSESSFGKTIIWETND